MAIVSASRISYSFFVQGNHFFKVRLILFICEFSFRLDLINGSVREWSENGKLVHKRITYSCN